LKSYGYARAQNYSENFEIDKFEFIYEEPTFFGKCFSEGAFFPFDSYKLVFIFAFSEDQFLQRNDFDFLVSFEDLFFYSDWEIDHIIEKKMERRIRLDQTSI